MSRVKCKRNSFIDSLVNFFYGSEKERRKKKIQDSFIGRKF